MGNLVIKDNSNTANLTLATKEGPKWYLQNYLNGSYFGAFCPDVDGSFNFYATPDGDFSIKRYLYSKSINLSDNGVATNIHNQNSSYTHYETTGSRGHWFNKNLYVSGDIYAGSSYADLVLTAANLYQAAYKKVTFSTSAGWHPIAYIAVGSENYVRGLTEFTVFTEGGNDTPSGTKISIDLSWSFGVENINIEGNNRLIGGCRIKYHSSYTFIELYFNTSVSTGYVLYNMEALNHHNRAQRWSWYAEQLYNASNWPGSVAGETMHYSGQSTSGTFTGSILYLKAHDITFNLGSLNSGYVHFQNNKGVPYHFDTDVRVQGNVYAGSSYADLVLTTANFDSNINVMKITKDSNNYWGFTPKDDSSAWIRTTSQGLIPYQKGGAGNGHCYLGTDTWYFKYAYIDEIYGSTFSGNAATASWASGAGYLDAYMTFTPAETAISPDDVFNLINKSGFVARRGSWSYAANGYIDTSVTGFGSIDLAGCTLLQTGSHVGQYTQLYITASTSSGTPNAINGEMVYYINNGSAYRPSWYRVLTNNNYTSYTVTKTGSGASGTWGINISGTAAYVRASHTYEAGTTITASTSAETLFANGSVMSCAFMSDHPIFGSYADVIYFTGYEKWGGSQIALSYNSKDHPCMAIRKYTQSGNTWGSWNTVLMTNCGSGDPNSSTPGYGIHGYVYFKIVG